MSDKSLGEVIGRLFEVDISMWNNQENLYEIRRMSVEQFKEKYWQDADGAEKLWEILKKACDLNVKRNSVMDEVDSTIISRIKRDINDKK